MVLGWFYSPSREDGEGHARPARVLDSIPVAAIATSCCDGSYTSSATSDHCGSVDDYTRGEPFRIVNEGVRVEGATILERTRRQRPSTLTEGPVFEPAGRTLRLHVVPTNEGCNLGVFLHNEATRTACGHGTMRCHVGADTGVVDRREGETTWCDVPSAASRRAPRRGRTVRNVRFGLLRRLGEGLEAAGASSSACGGASTLSEERVEPGEMRA